MGLMHKPLVFAITGLVLGASASAANFTISNYVTSRQTIGNNDTGTVTSSGTVRITSGDNEAIRFNGATSGTLNNSGLLLQSATGRAVRFRGNGTYTINNFSGGTIRAVAEDGIQANGTDAPAANVTINNYGTIEATGGQAIDLNNILTGSNTVNNTGLIIGNIADAIRTGSNGVVVNSGTIRTVLGLDNLGKAEGSDGIDGQERSGSSITNSGLISGRHGITGGKGDVIEPNYRVTIVNQLGGVIEGRNGSSINIDNLDSAAHITNYGTLTGTYDATLGATEGDGDGVDVDGVITLHNYGTIRGLGGHGGTNTIEGIAAGGGTIVNYAGAVISGQATVGNSTKANGILIDDSDEGSAVAATHITNAGTIQGHSGFGIKIVGSHDNTITNEASGTIAATGDLVISTGGGNDIVENRGSLVGEAGQQAVDLGAGNNIFTVRGGTASIVGNVSGGVGGSNTFHLDPGAGNTFTYTGEISNFAAVNVQSGTVTLAGNSVYTGTTTLSSGATLVADNSVGSATGTGLVEVQEDATLTGSGTIGGSVLLREGGILASQSEQALRVEGGLALESGARFTFSLATAAPVQIEGLLSIIGGTPVLVDLLGNTWEAATYTLLTFSESSILDLGQFQLGLTPEGFTSSLFLTDNTLSVRVDAVPEPSVFLLSSVLLAGVIPFLRNRRKKW